MERQQGEQAGAPLGRPPRQRSQPSRFERARALQLEGRLQEAETLYRQALAAGEENADLLSNLSVLCWQRGDYEEMELLLRRALALAPTAANIHFNLALVLAQREASDEAIRHYRHALGSASGSLLASVHWNLSKLLLRCGQYSEGWSHYEWRSRRAQPLPPICQPGMRRWDGRGRVSGELLLVGEQGLGDMLQFLRYAPAMAAFADRVTLCLPEPLQPLVQSSGLPVSLIPPEMAAAQRSGHWLPLLSAPALLGVTPAEVVVAAPYLSVPRQRVEHWRQQLRRGMNSQERLIALHWQGNPAAETNELQGRSLPVRALEPLGQLAGVRFVSLQKGAGSEQPLGAAIASKLVPSQAEVSACWDFVETGAIALACDLLISSDSALPHLAGALGVPTWLLLHHSSDWRWGEAGDSTSWYPSMRLFRQQRPGDWPGVIAAVVSTLKSYSAETAIGETLPEAGMDDQPQSTTKSEPNSPGLAVAKLERQAERLLQHNRPTEAEVIYRQLLDQGSASATALANLGAICGASGRIDEAVPLLEQALLLNPHQPSALSNLAEAHWQRNRWHDAEPLLQRLLELDAGNLQAINKLRSLASRWERHEQAVALARLAVELAPEAPEAHYNLGIELRQAGALAEACQSYEQALALRPGYAEAEANLSIILLLQGDYRRGLPLREARLRKQNPVRPIVEPPLPRWQPDKPTAISGPLLVVGEQGLGDMMQFMRYVPGLRHREQEVWLCLPNKLVELARVSGIAATVLSPAELAERGTPPTGHWVPLLSLPWHLGVTPEQPLITTPYLQSTPLRRHQWQERLWAAAGSLETGRRRPVLGLHWQGDIEVGSLQGRSLALEHLAPLADQQELAFLSLQKGAGSEQLQRCSFRHRFLSCQAQVEECWDFVDCAAIVLACDLVITSDSGLAHLAGALGVPTWLLLHHRPDWRWGEAGDSTFWYPSMRLFRQQRPGDWPGVIASVRQELERWIRERAEAEPAIDSPMPPDSDSDGNKMGDQSLGQGDRLGCDSPVRKAPAPPGLQVIVKPSVWRSHVITLDPEGPRFQAFTKDNPSLNPEIMLGLRGDRIAPEERIAQGLVTEALSRSGLLPEGTFGCALSHRQLWQQACNEEGGTLILEDDVITHPHLRDWIDEHQQQLLQRHITHFSVNTDSVLTILTPQGLVQSSLFEPKRPDSTWISQALRATKASDVQLVRFLKGFGMCCYFLSPEGANRLLASTFPLTLETAPIPLISKAMPGFSIDRRLNAFYPTLRASLTLPFLAYTPNNDSSTQS